MAAADPTSPVVAGILTEYDRGSASFKARKDFFYTWRRNGDHLEVILGDYIEDAPEHVLFDMGRNIALRSRTKEHMEYPLSFINHVTTDDFIQAKRPIFLKRSRNLAGNVNGDHHDLTECLQRLYDQGLVDDDDIDNAYLSWCTTPTYRRLGFCSSMFRVIGLSPIMDRPEVPGYVVDYVLYHECMHLRQGFHWGHRSHTVEFHDWEHRHPMWREAEAFFPRFRKMA